jgi:AcrR family transcriptional regulator
MRKRFAREVAEESAELETLPRIRSERQLQILAVAARLFRERGYHATTMGEIGAEAGITGPAIYRHFRSKDELLRLAIWTLSRRVAGAVRSAREAASYDPFEQLQALVRAFVRVVVAQRDLACVYLFETRHVRKDLYEEFHALERAWHEEWIEALRQVRPDLDERRALTLIRAASFLVGSVTLDTPLLEGEALETTLADALMAALLRDHPEETPA